MTAFHRTAIMPILRWIWLLPAIYLVRAAVLILGVSVWLAPSHKKLVTWGGVYRVLRRCALPGLAPRGLG